MGEPNPVTVYRSDLTGRWYAASSSTPLRGGKPGVMVAKNKRDVANGDQLEKMWDNHSWLEALLRFTGKTREEIADDYGCVIAEKGSANAETQ